MADSTEGTIVVVLDGKEQVLDLKTGQPTEFKAADTMCWDRTRASHRFAPETPILIDFRAVPCEGDDTVRTLDRDQLESWAGTDGWVTLLRGDTIYAYR